jgi:hypothetical protein
MERFSEAKSNESFNIEHVPVKCLHVTLKLKIPSREVGDFATLNFFGMDVPVRPEFLTLPPVLQTKYNYISGNKIDKNMKIFVLIVIEGLLLTVSNIISSFQVI